MEITFVVSNTKGDQIRVDLSDYDHQNVEIFTSDPSILNLVFYNISLERVGYNESYLNPAVLFTVCDSLAKFLEENPSSILTFYCDPKRDIPRNHLDMSPQEYRSKLFSKLFDYYILTKNCERLINKVLVIEDSADKSHNQYFHLIGKETYKDQIDKISRIILDK